MDLAALKNEVATLSCETAKVEFKSTTDTSEARFWVQLIRSVMAMHNSGGGVIVFGLDSAGQPVGGDLTALRAIDPVHISDKAKHYTDRPLPGVVREEFDKNGGTFPGWIIPAAASPVPFSRHGDVHNGQGKPEKLFYAGQIYVRRGAASVPADAGDIALIAERIRNLARQEFAAQIGQFAVVPEGHTIQILPPGGVVSGSTPAGSVRITTDPNAPGAVIVDKFKTHPHNKTELVKRLLTRIPGIRITGHDIACIRKVYASEIEPKDFVWRPVRCPPQYPEEFIEWIAGRIGQDPAFLEKTRAARKRGAAA